MTCLFVEPWIGQCKRPEQPGQLCCDIHAKDKCQVCGEQATTRCQASIGVMCGVPLCDQCGHGEMCLFHASTGPLAVLRGVLGGGPVLSIFATDESDTEYRQKMEATVKRLKRFKFSESPAK